MRIALCLLVVVACSKSDKVSEVVKGLEAIKDEMCACKDKACSVKVGEK